MNGQMGFQPYFVARVKEEKGNWGDKISSGGARERERETERKPGDQEIMRRNRIAGEHETR